MKIDYFSCVHENIFLTILEQFSLKPQIFLRCNIILLEFRTIFV
jgi:hypothetical protein